MAHVVISHHSHNEIGGVKHKTQAISESTRYYNDGTVITMLRVRGYKATMT